MSKIVDENKPFWKNDKFISARNITLSIAVSAMNDRCCHSRCENLEHVCHNTYKCDINARDVNLKLLKNVKLLKDTNEFDDTDAPLRCQQCLRGEEEFNRQKEENGQ